MNQETVLDSRLSSEIRVSLNFRITLGLHCVPELWYTKTLKNVNLANQLVFYWFQSFFAKYFVPARNTNVPNSESKHQYISITYLLNGSNLLAFTLHNHEVEELNRDQLLVEKPKMTNEQNNNNFSFPFVTGFSHQHFLIKKLVRKHWHILKIITYLAPFSQINHRWYLEEFLL